MEEALFPANIQGRSSDFSVAEHDRDLVLRAQDGDRDAFGELYRRHVDAVHRIVRSHLGPDTDDAVAETFLRAWRGLDRYQDRGKPFVAWLAGIARFVVLDEGRRRRRVAPVDAVPEEGREPMTAEVLTLRDALEQLPAEQRQVIELKYLVGMSNEEIAGAMGGTPGSVNARRWRALRSLSELLEDR